MFIESCGNATIWYPDGDMEIQENVNFVFECEKLPGVGFVDISLDSLYRYGYRCRVYIYKDTDSPFRKRRDYYDSPVGINNQ